MAKVLLVKIPQTVDGMNLAYDADGQPITKSVILPLTARREQERNFNTYPVHLRPKYSEIEAPIAADAPEEEEYEITPETLNKLSKPKLRALYLENLEAEAPADFTRPQLIEALLNA